MDDVLNNYRQHLVESSQKAQEDFDKTVIYLSGGALGISFAFVKDILGNTPWINTWMLFIAWISWSVSMCCVLFSYYSSNRAILKMIDQVDKNLIYEEKPGGNFRSVTEILNILGAGLFIVGVIMIIIFAGLNLR